MTTAHRSTGGPPAELPGSTRPPTATPGALAALAEALASESRLLDDLVGIMRRQRAAVAADDLALVDDSVHATHRALLTLGEARQRRRALNRLICEDDDLAIRQLEDLLGGVLPDALQAARSALRRSAEALATEVETNRRVLRQALASGDAYVRSLIGAVTDGRPGTAPAPAPGGRLINRRG